MKLEKDILKNLSLLSQVGLLMAIPIIGCILLGHYLDTKFGTNVVFLIIFTVLGVLAAFRNLYVLFLKKIPAQKKDTRK